MSASSRTPANRTPRLSVFQGNSLHPDASRAVQEVAARINRRDSRLTLVYFSSDYDHQALAQALQQHFPSPVIGCTTAGQLSFAGFQRGGLSGLSLVSDELIAIPYLIAPLSSLRRQVERIAGEVQQQLQRSGLKAFGLLLADGLSNQEELLADALYRSLGDIPIVGGSAGDMLHFDRTSVYWQGRLLHNAAVFTLCLTSLPFLPFKHQHYLPTGTRLVVTEVEPARRLVREINGEQAARAYARALGILPAQLDSTVFSRSPLMLRIHDDYYIRAIAGIEGDGSLRMYCAVDKGLVLSIGNGLYPQESLECSLQQVKREIGSVAVILGCDCILRRLELEQRGLDHSVGGLMGDNKIFGFSTYGEQFNSLHINQTFTGIAISE